MEGHLTHTGDKDMIPDFSKRAEIDELMDNPNCDEAKLLRTVRQFASINRLVSRYRTILRREVLGDMRPGRAYHLVDMGAGGCDIDVWLLQAARKRGLDLRIAACDIDPRIIAYARSTFGNVQGLEIREKDLLEAEFDEPVDYIFANHFLHHLDSETIVRLLETWHPRVRRKMLFSDLQRDPLSYWGYALLSLFYPSSFARVDGLISIRRGFLPEELVALTNAAKIAGGSIHRLLPGRLVLCIDGNRVNPN